MWDPLQNTSVTSVNVGRAFMVVLGSLPIPMMKRREYLVTVLSFNYKVRLTVMAIHNPMMNLWVVGVERFIVRLYVVIPVGGLFVFGHGSTGIVADPYSEREN